MAKLDKALSKLPMQNTGRPEDSPHKPAVTKFQHSELEPATLVESITDVRRELLEITSKLKNGLSSAKQDFARESQQMADADSKRDSRVNVLTRRIDQLEADVHRFDELISSTGQKLSLTAMTASAASATSESNAEILAAASSSLSLLKEQVRALDITVTKIGRKSLSIKLLAVLGMLGLLGMFGIYRLTVLPDTRQLEQFQQENSRNIDKILNYLYSPQ